MGIKKIAISAIAAGMVVASSLLGASSAHATGNLSSLDQGDFTIQCQHQYGSWGWQAKLVGSTAVDWKCVDLFGLGSQRKPIDVAGYCWRLWGMSAHYSNYNNPNSWYCSQ